MQYYKIQLVFVNSLENETLRIIVFLPMRSKARRQELLASSFFIILKFDMNLLEERGISFS